ncbi:MAG: winged helix-turn-helix transcriptional regulator, partial [Thermoguttaceae bacterium]
VILCDEAVISADLLALKTRRRSANSDARTRTDLSLEDYFRAFIEEHEAGTTETELAERLGISRKALWERRQRLGMPRTGKR